MGSAIAVALGEAGATVYCTGRSVRGAPSDIGRPETIEESLSKISAVHLAEAIAAALKPRDAKKDRS